MVVVWELGSVLVGGPWQVAFVAVDAAFGASFGGGRSWRETWSWEEEGRWSQCW